MPIDPINAVLDVLRKDSRLSHNASSAVNYLMDLLYYGEFSIFEQVSWGETQERVNLIGVKGTYNDPDPLWLVSSISTGAEPSPAAWASTGGDPFAARRDDRSGLIHGLGATSGKVDMVLKILAASRFRTEELRRPIQIVALTGEEPGGTSVHSLIDASQQPTGVALVGAPTNLELWTDQPGCITLRLTLSRRIRHRRMPPCRGFFEIEIAGRSAHAQRPGLGKDALARGMEVLAGLREAGDIRILEVSAGEAANRIPAHCRLRIATSYDELPPLPSDCVGRGIEDGTALPFPIDALFDAWWTARDTGITAIEGLLGSPRNRGPARPRIDAWTGSLQTDRDEVSGTVMLWTGPGVDTREIVEAFAAAGQHALVGMDELEVAIQVNQDRPAFAATEGDERLLGVARKALIEVGVPPVLSGGPLTSDAAYMRNFGVQTLVFGPGRGIGDRYRDDEPIPIAHLEAAYRFYERVIQMWCVEGIG